MANERKTERDEPQRTTADEERIRGVGEADNDDFDDDDDLDVDDTEEDEDEGAV